MTFGAMAAWQAWLLLAGSRRVAAALFLIKLRPPRMLVPSLLALAARARRVAGPDAVGAHPPRGVARRHRRDRDRPGARGRRGHAPGRSGAAAPRPDAHRARFVVVDAGEDARTAKRGGTARIAEARRLAASSEQVALATTADGLVEGLTDDAVLVETALDRLSPVGVARYVVAAVSRRRCRALHHRRRDGPAARCVGRRALGLRGGGNVAITAFDVRPTLGSGRRGPMPRSERPTSRSPTSPSKPQTVHITLARGSRRSPIAEPTWRRRGVPAGRAARAPAATRISMRTSRPPTTRSRWTTMRSPGSRAQPARGRRSWESTRRGSACCSAAIRTCVPRSSRRRRTGPGREDVVIFDRWAPSHAARDAGALLRAARGHDVARRRERPGGER